MLEGRSCCLRREKMSKKSHEFVWYFIASVEMVTKRSDATRFQASLIFRGPGWNAGTRTLCVGFELRNYPLVEMDGLLTNTSFFSKRTG